MAARKEETKRAADDYYVDFRLEGGKRLLQEHFEKGAEWADEHPREGLWDAEKVTEWLKNNSSNYMVEGKNYPNYAYIALVEDLAKAMKD